jgi:hypothetical protein
VTLTIPPKPASFTPEGVAPGCQRIANLYPREISSHRMDIQVVHTNWAPNPGSIQSAINWTTGAPGKNTYAHYIHELDGDAAKMLDTHRRGIGNSGLDSYWDQYGLPNASYRGIVYETCDRGTNTDPAPNGSFFTEPQMQALCRDLAYECMVHGIPPVLLTKPDGRGIVGHCIPFPYPAFTTAPGKLCPGHRKFDQLVRTVIPHVAAIVNAWKAPPPVVTPPTPEPPEEDDMPLSDEDANRIAWAVWSLALDNGFSAASNLKTAANAPTATVNYPLPVPEGGHADAWTIGVDTRERVKALEAKVDKLLGEIEGPE